MSMAVVRWRTLEAETAPDAGIRIALSLHDCYGPTWIEQYPAFLGRLLELGTLQTLDQVAAEVVLADAD